MEKKNVSSILRYVAFAIFTYFALTRIRYHFYDIIYSDNVLAAIMFGILPVGGFILIPVGIICKQRTLSMAGCILWAVHYTALIIHLLSGGCSDLIWLAGNFLQVAAYAAAALCCMRKGKKALALGTASALLFLLIDLISLAYFCSIDWENPISQVFSLKAILVYAAFFLLAFAFEDVPEKKIKKAKPSHNALDDKIERLTRLKDLLDKGVLTQEEFDEKKKQVLEK